MYTEDPKWSENMNFRQLAASLRGATIETALLVEDRGTCFLRMKLSDGRTINVGVSGNLYDEAYLVFNNRAR